jgi:siroheme synthase
VVEGLIAGGLAPDTPAAAVSRGTLRDQEVARAPLSKLASATHGLASPTLLVVGDVAALELVAPRKLAIAQEGCLARALDYVA